MTDGDFQGERGPRPPRDPVEDLLMQVELQNDYLGMSGDVRLRFDPYRLSADGRLMPEEVLERVCLRPGQQLLDVGCADGSLLQRIALTHPGNVKLWGLDNSQNYINAALLKQELNHLPEVNFMVGDVQDLSFFPDDSFDMVTALFMLYHADDPRRALAEIHRILKKPKDGEPQGTLLATTSGQFNKMRHRQFEAEIAAAFDVTPPPHFNERFNAANAVDLLEECFEVDSSAASPPQLSQMVIRTPDEIASYALSLESMAHSFSPKLTEREVREFIQTHIYPIIMGEIVRNGYFADTIHREMYVAHPKDMAFAAMPTPS